MGSSGISHREKFYFVTLVSQNRDNINDQYSDVVDVAVVCTGLRAKSEEPGIIYVTIKE